MRCGVHQQFHSTKGRGVDGHRGLGRPLSFGWSSGSPCLFCLPQTVVDLGSNYLQNLLSKRSVVQKVPSVSQ